MLGFASLFWSDAEALWNKTSYKLKHLTWSIRLFSCRKWGNVSKDISGSSKLFSYYLKYVNWHCPFSST